MRRRSPPQASHFVIVTVEKPHVQEYNYWGFGKNEPPPNLKTKKQLSALGLSPLEPVGVIKTSEYNLYLYDPDSPTSARSKRKCSEKQLENLAKVRQSQIRKSKYRKWYLVTFNLPFSASKIPCH
jgi:DNA polymerase-3 subunit epsilon